MIYKKRTIFKTTAALRRAAYNSPETLTSLSDAIAANDATAERKAMADLQSNVTAIAQFLSGANPNLPANAVQGLMATHVAHHATQIQQIMAGDMKGEQSTWQAIQAHMDVISDALAGAIAKQFPAKAA